MLTYVSVWTNIEPPGTVEYLKSEWDDQYNLTLKWNHPYVANGPLIQFHIKISSNGILCKQFPFPVNKDNYSTSYTYMIPLETCYSSEVNVTVTAINSMFRGSETSIIITTPPRTARFTEQPSVESIASSSITLDLPNVENFEGNSVMYIVVSNTKLNPKYATNIDVVPEVKTKLALPSEFFSWIVAEFKATPIGRQEFVIGDDTKSYSNHTINNLDEIPLTDKKNKSKPRKTKDKHSASSTDENKSTTYSRSIKITNFAKYVKESIENGELERQYQLIPRGQIKPWCCGSQARNKLKNRFNNIIAYDHTRVRLTKLNNDPFSDYINANYIAGYNPSKSNKQAAKASSINRNSEPEYCYIDPDYIQNSEAIAASNSSNYGYIDVSYVEGDHGKKTYIATQGPKATTVNDFWRMIWQEKVKYIVNLTNIKEGDKEKTEQYWPNAGEDLKYGDIQVKYVSSKIFSDYEYRTFTIRRNNKDRQIEHLHFTSWPDHGVPLYIQSLVPFFQKVLAIPRGVHPIVIHCSDGIGSTGTAILCDLCLKMADAEGAIDVLKHLYHLRNQRVNLVDSVEQYKLAHLVLLQCLFSSDTKIECNEETESIILQLLKSLKLKRQFQHINDTTWQNQAIRPLLDVTAKPEWSVKDRFQNIIPAAYGQIYLCKYPADDDYSDYINAVRVDGFRCPEQFIVTQQPLKHTVSDFWRMIDEQQVTTIVSLNKINIGDETSCIFWPTPKTRKIQPVPYLVIEFQERVSNDNHSTTILNLCNKEKYTKSTINLITLKGWIANKVVPDSEESLLKLWEETKKIGKGKNPIVVTCYDGAKACGLFVALSFVIEKIKFEQECDICLAIQTVRLNRKQLLTKMDQFAFLYEAAVIYLRSFDLYSNFSTLNKR
ncbi:hypothetical protein ILUMI_07551 [Ignelater luminosus]|uniref:protein-tyrosine-phosphatase n=1 Tax=Ignelater luminosus TaxID=2038154 RepID=A0A8K0D389_IGNLU|nr:hypothetical protein ILUMI_07551 [Ignelater luminosus]